MKPETPNESFPPEYSRKLKRLVCLMDGEHTRGEIERLLNLTSAKYLRDSYLYPGQKAGIIERTIPDKPSSSRQRHRLTAAGLALRKTLLAESETKK